MEEAHQRLEWRQSIPHDKEYLRGREHAGQGVRTGKYRHPPSIRAVWLTYRQVNYAGRLYNYAQEIRAVLPQFEGVNVVKAEA